MKDVHVQLVLANYENLNFTTSFEVSRIQDQNQQFKKKKINRMTAVDIKWQGRVCVTASKMTLNLKCLRHPVAKLVTRGEDDGTLYIPLRATACAGRRPCNERYLRGKFISENYSNHHLLRRTAYDCHKGWINIAGYLSGAVSNKCSHQTHRLRCIYKNICIFLQGVGRTLKVSVSFPAL